MTPADDRNLAGESRYSRQRLFTPVGDRGQARLSEARVGLVGCGALGSTIADHLVRAGVGYLRLVDRDFLELNNLQRQTLYTEEDVAARLPKAVAAAERLGAVNSEVEVEAQVQDIDSHSIRAFGEGLECLVDGTDNFAVRYLLNDYAVSKSIPWVYAGVIGASGMTLTVVPGDGPCLRCVFPQSPTPGSTPTCDTAGIVGPAPGVLGGIEALEVMKLIVDPEARNRGLLTIDLWESTFEMLDVQRNPDCPACGRSEFPFLDAAEEGGAVKVCGRDAIQVSPGPGVTLDLNELGLRLSGGGAVEVAPFLLVFEAEGKTVTVFADGRAMIKGTEDTRVARGIYARYIGEWRFVNGAPHDCSLTLRPRLVEYDKPCTNTQDYRLRCRIWRAATSKGFGP